MNIVPLYVNLRERVRLLCPTQKGAQVQVQVQLELELELELKGRVRFPKRTRRRSCRDSGRPESAEFFFCFFVKVVLCNETPRSRVLRVFEFFEFFRVFSMGVNFGQGSAPLT